MIEIEINLVFPSNKKNFISNEDTTEQISENK